MAKTRVWPWILAFLLVAIAIFAGLAWFLNRMVVGVPSVVRTGSVLEVDLGTSLGEIPAPRFGRYVLGRATVQEVDEAIRRAAADERVVALALEVGTGSGGFAKAQEVRQAVATFRDRGKPVVAYLQDATNVDLMTAVAADDVFLPPTANLYLGMVARRAYYRGLLERLGVRFEVFHTGPYKTAMNWATERSMTEGERETANSLLDSVYGQWVEAVADGRGVEPAEVRRAADQGLVTATEARDSGLVDELGYRDQVSDRLREIAGQDPHRLGVWDYLRATGDEDWLFDGPEIAVVHVSGMIVPGGFDEGPLSEGLASGEAIAGYLREAREDPNVEAIVLRIDSPGGAVTPSDVIWRAARVAAEEKPVVASMSDVAASGGYWVATAAGRIVADPATTTGSIGVVMSRLDLSGAYDKLEINHELILRGRNADILQEVEPLRPEQEEIFRSTLENLYERFLQRVAGARELTVKEVRGLAEGRPWTGEQALDRGLVDELGGLRAGLEAARSAAGLSEADYRVRVYPEPPGMFQQITRFLALGDGPGLRQPDPRGNRLAEALRLLRLLRTAGPIWALADAPVPAGVR